MGILSATILRRRYPKYVDVIIKTAHLGMEKYFNSFEEEAQISFPSHDAIDAFIDDDKQRIKIKQIVNNVFHQCDERNDEWLRTKQLALTTGGAWNHDPFPFVSKGEKLIKDMIGYEMYDRMI